MRPVHLEQITNRSLRLLVIDAHGMTCADDTQKPTTPVGALFALYASLGPAAFGYVTPASLDRPVPTSHEQRQPLSNLNASCTTINSVQKLCKTNNRNKETNASGRSSATNSLCCHCCVRSWPYKNAVQPIVPCADSVSKNTSKIGAGNGTRSATNRLFHYRRQRRSAKCLSARLALPPLSFPSASSLSAFLSKPSRTRRNFVERFGLALSCSGRHVQPTDHGRGRTCGAQGVAGGGRGANNQVLRMILRNFDTPNYLLRPRATPLAAMPMVGGKRNHEPGRGGRFGGSWGREGRDAYVHT